MTGFSSLLGAVAHGIDALDGFDRGAALDAGVNPARVREWEKVHEVYFGATRWTRQQRLAVEAAQASRTSLDQLIFIEHRVRHITDARSRWRVRQELLSTPADYGALKRAAADIAPPREDSPPTAKVTFGRSVQGKRRMTVVADERTLADVESFLRRGLDPAKPEAPQMVAPLIDLLRGRGSAGVPVAAPRPLIVIGLPDYVQIRDGSGHDTILGLTDGTTMTGAEYLTHHYGEELEVALFHPQVGPVNLYRTQRLANQKQRDLVRAASTVCASPDCRHAADNCEIHHLTAWKHGGPTNLANLAPVCRYHNRINDDAPGSVRRGRVINIRGRPTWVSPRGYPVPNTTHPYGAMNVLFG